jgi:hypothetical protein
MSSQTPTISLQLKTIKSFLNAWAREEGGVCEIAHDLSEMWLIAFRSSKVPRCILCCVGEDVRGDFTIAAPTGRVDRQFVCLVTRGKGMTADRGDTLVDAVGDIRPFYDILEEARDIIRALVLDTTTQETPIDYKGFKSALPDDVPMDAYMIEFSIGTQLAIPVDN